MPFKKTIAAEVNRKFTIQFSTPTEDIFDVQTFHKYFNSEAAYCLIPGVESTSLLDTERFLLQILPHTTNCILDITMPFTEVTKKKNIVRHLGRYIICDRQLFGIRIKPSDNWPKSKTIRQEIPPNLQKFYDQNRITNYPKEIVIGEFLVATQHFKLAPLFTSELCSLLDNTTINLLNDYYSLGCEIFSIISDLTEEKKKALKDPFDILKNYRRDTTVVVCSGMHMNVDPSQIYKSKSYAIQASDRLKKIHVNRFDQIYTEQFIADMNQTKKGRKISHFDESKLITSDIEIIDCKHLRIKQTYQKIDFHAIGRFQEPMDLEQEQNEFKIKQNELLLYLWNLYVKVNKRKPFVLPLPMNDKDETLMKKILQLQQVTNLQKSDLINFLKLDPKAKVPKKYEILNFKAFNLQKINVADGQYLPIYFSLKQRIIKNNIQKDERFLQEVERKLFNCLGCIGEEIFKALENESATEKIQVADEDQKFIEKFLKKKVATLQMFYFEMARYYSRTKLTAEYLQNMYENMKIMAKKEFIGTPFQTYLLQTSYDGVHNLFVESEQKYFFKESNIKNEEEPIEGQLNEPEQNNLRALIKRINYHIFVQKKSHHGCHICGALFSKKSQSASYGRMCLGCNNFVCYSCFDKKTGETAQSEQQFQQCLVCQNKCDCEKCMKKKYKNQGFNDFGAQKMSFFRSSNNLNGSTQNIRMNKEEMAPQESKSILNNQIKSQVSLKESANKSSIFRESGAHPEQILIQPCWTCQLQNRTDRIVRFQCNTCKAEKCYYCEKNENSKRSFVLRGPVLCNNCFNDQQQTVFQEAEIRILKSKIIALEHQLAISKRAKFLSPVPYNDFSILQEINEHESESNNQNKGQKGSATPIFDRSEMTNKESSSPLNFGSGRKNSSENESVASFGGNQTEMKKEDQPKKRKNSSDSGGSRSVGSRKSQSFQKRERPKRKNSSGSEKSSIASFKNKTSRERQNSSRGSKSSKRSETKKMKQGRNSSAESGEYNESSSSNQHKETKPREWKNYHNNNEESNNIERGGYRPRGDRGGRGNNRGDRQGGNRDFKKWDNNKDQQRDFRGRNDDFKGRNNNFRGSNTNRFNNDDRQGGFNNRGRGRNFDNRNQDRNQDRNQRDYDNNNTDDRINSNLKDENTNRNDGLLFVKSNSNNNDEDVEY